MRAGGIRIALAAPASTSVCGPPPKALLTRWTYPEIGSSMTMPLTVLEKSLNHPVVLLLKDHHEHLSDLPLERQVRLYEDVARVAGVLRQELHPLRVNYACLGNLMAHVHWHVTPRYPDDPEVQHPIWVRPLAERRVALAEPDRRALIAQLRRALGR